MFFTKSHFLACQTFKRDDIEINDTIKKILQDTRDRLEELDYKAIIISIIK